MNVSMYRSYHGRSTSMAYQEEPRQESPYVLSRRQLVATTAAGIGAMVVGSRNAMAQAKSMAPPSTVTTPPRDFGPNGAPTTYFTDPDVLTIDPSFDNLRQPNAPIQRLWTGALWSEGPAWSGQGRYLVWSDIPNNLRLAWCGEDGPSTAFEGRRTNINGTTFDFQGRQLSCEHL